MGREGVDIVTTAWGLAQLRVGPRRSARYGTEQAARSNQGGIVAS